MFLCVCVCGSSADDTSFSVAQDGSTALVAIVAGRTPPTAGDRGDVKLYIGVKWGGGGRKRERGDGVG